MADQKTIYGDYESTEEPSQEAKEAKGAPKKPGRPKGSKNKKTGTKKPTRKKAPAKKPVKVQAYAVPETIWVEKEFKVSGRRVFYEETEDTIAIHMFQTHPSVAGFNKKLTKNLGDYESATVGVMLTRPCYVEMEDETLDDISGKADKRLTEELLGLVQLKRNMEV